MKRENKIALYKTLTYRGVCIVWIFSIAFFLTGDPWQGLEWAMLHQAVLTVFYFIHEKAWARVLDRT